MAGGLNQLEQEKFCVLAKDVIKQALKQGASAAEVAIHIALGFTVNIRQTKVETLERNWEQALNITVYFGNHCGNATTSDLTPAAIHTTLTKACHIARFTNDDPYVGLAAAQLMAYDYQKLKLELYHPWHITVAEAIELAKHAENQGLCSDKRIVNSEGAILETIEALGVYANSHGFCGATATTKHGFSCSFVAANNNEMQHDYYYTVARDPADLKEATKVAIQAANRTVMRLNARRIATQKRPVMFSAEVGKSLIGHLLQAINGNNIYRRSSFLCDHLQQLVLAKHINLEEHPHLPKALGSAAFDDEGVKLSQNNIVIAGILQRYILNSYSARKLAMQTTGNAGGVHNVLVNTSSNFTQRELLREMNTGLLVTELMGDGVNIVTGNYSRGAFGYWVANGEIQYPVTGITIAGNLKEMLLNIVAIGNDIDYRSNILTGSILLDRMTIAGN